MATDRAADASGGPPVYAEARPSPTLAPWVRCFWSIRGTVAHAVPNRVLPDGCADVIVDLGRMPRAFAVGPMRTAEVVTIDGRVDLFGIRFQPGAALAAFDVPLGELCDREVALGTLWGALAGELEDALASVPPRGRRAQAERILAARLQPGAATAAEHAVVAKAVALTRRSRGTAGVRDVAAALGVGERWLERAFDRRVGLSPKFLARVERFRHVVRLVDGDGPPSWTAIAYEAGYADQAHLTRECRALAGVTPGALAAERRGVGFVQYADGEPA